MSTVNQTEALNALILTLEERKSDEFRLLKAQLRRTGESLKPVNLIKSAANELTANKKLKSYLIQAGIGLAVGYFTNKFQTANKTRKSANLVGNIAELGLNQLTGNQINLIKMAAPLLIGFIVNAVKNRKRKAHRIREEVL